MDNFLVIRLGKASVQDIKRIDAAQSSQQPPIVLDIKCTQVPDQVSKGDYAFLWLGSDNNKGTPTAWVQGLRAFGIITAKAGGPGYKDDWTVSLEVPIILPRSIDRQDFLTETADAYPDFSGVPVIGVSSSSNQTVQLIKDKQPQQDVKALFYALRQLFPGFQSEVIAAFPDLAGQFEYNPAKRGAGAEKPKGAGPNPFTDLKGLLSDFRKALEKANIRVEPGIVQRLVAGLITKPFVILTGLSGSGKSKLAQAFATWLSEETEYGKSQTIMIPVGADWTSREPILGYPDALVPGDYRLPVSGALQLLLRAKADPQRPYFLILDEMNLSHVERYFADILSAMESNLPIPLHENVTYPGKDWNGVPMELPLPANVFVLGTVNIDETTYMFSPKVLDRANVIEFKVDRSEIIEFLGNPASVQMTELSGAGSRYAPAFVKAASTRDISLSDVPEGASALEISKTTLSQIFDSLAPVGAEFGYRPTYEISRFICCFALLAGDGWSINEALDAAIMQKLLPKLHGSKTKLGPVLAELKKIVTKDKFAICYSKMERMEQRLKQNGFTSYAEA